MFEVLTLNKIAKIGLDKLGDNFTVTDEVKNPDGILLRSFAMHDMELPENLKAVARAGAGTNNIPIDKCSEKGVVVFNTPGANANAVKELAIGALFLASRDVVGGIKWAETLKDEGDAVPKLVEKGKSAFVGPEITGKTIGVIGLGAIGVMVANAAHSLGMEVLGYDPFISIDAAWHLSRKVVHVNSINEIFAKCDYITLHLPLNDKTKYTINKDTIALMKDGARVINFSRNELVNNEDILAAIAEGKIAKYVTDFPSADLIGVDNVICIPHLGASTPESEDNCAVMAAKELRDYLENGNITNSVNFPACHAPRETAVRICIIHKNIPAMINAFTSFFADNNINIENLINKSKGDYAYTLIDTASDIPEIEEKILAIDGVIKVRVIK